jgi:hypothetical protein
MSSMYNPNGGGFTGGGVGTQSDFMAKGGTAKQYGSMMNAAKIAGY